MAVAIPQTRGGVGAWREQWASSWLVRAFSPSNNPYLVHELNLIARDRRFLFIAVVTLGFMGLAYRYMGVVSNKSGLVFLQEAIPFLAIFASFVLLFYRLQRPHIRYHAENALFLCMLPRDGAELLYCQVVAVLFQPVMLFMLLLPGCLLLLALGVMSPLHLGMKLALGLLILVTLAVHGVCRVPRMTVMFFGFPLAFILFVAAAATVIMGIVSVVSALTFQSGSSTDAEVIMLAVFSGLVLCALPALLWFAMMNPLLTWLVQTTPWGESLRLSETWTPLRAPFELILMWMSQSGNLAGMNTVPITKIAQTVDQFWSVPTISAWNWAFLLGMQFLLMRDALIRGADQFEFFRVRGYPERLKELRWMERQRLRTRNQRTLSAQLRPIGVYIERTMPGVQTLSTWLVALIARPYAPRMAHRALTIEPDVLEAYYEQRRRTAAPAQRRPAGASVYGAGPASMPRTQPPPQPYIAPSAQVLTAPPPTHASPMPPPAPAYPDGPPPVAANYPESFPPATFTQESFPSMPPPPAYATPGAGPASRSVAAPPSQSVQDHPDDGRPVTARRRPAGQQMLWLTRPVGRLFGLVSRFLAGLIPAALRTNPYFMRDWRSMQRVLQGEQEGQWAYSWTVLLMINLAIASFVLFLTCTIYGLGLMVRIAEVHRNLKYGNQDVVEFSWVAEYAWFWLQYMCWSTPLVYFALPIYAWLKERKRPDWELTLLCPQMGAGWLAGKWAFFMQLAIIGIAALFLLLLLMDPLLWMGWIVPLLAQQVDVTWEPLLVNPISGVGYLLLLLGFIAWTYQTVQLATFLLMCFPTTQSKSRSFSFIWSLVGIVVSCWIMYEIAESGDLLVFLDANLPLLQDYIDALNLHVLTPLNYLFSLIGSFLAEMMPLTPWTLWNWYWGPNSGPSGGDFMLTAAQSSEAVLVALGIYWGFALLNYRLSLHLLQTRLRSLEPRTFSLIRKKLPPVEINRGARGPASVV